MAGNGFPEFQQNADDADIADRVVGVLRGLRQGRHESGNERRRRCRNHMVAGRRALVGAHARHLAVDNHDLADGQAETDGPALLPDRVDQCVDQSLRAAVDHAEFFLEHGFARRADALDARADPGGRNIVGILKELELHEPSPQHVIGPGAGPFDEPVLGIHVFEVVEGLALRLQEHLDAVTQLLGKRQKRELEQRERVAPAVVPAVDIVAH